MPVDDEIAEFALEIQKEIKNNTLCIEGMQSCLDSLRDKGEDDILAESFLIGLAACRRWHSDTRSEFKATDMRKEFTAYGSAAHTSAVKRYEELREENLDKYENLLFLGYMTLTNEKRFWVHRIRPLSQSIAWCLQKTYDDLEGQKVEEGIYKLLHRRLTRFRKGYQAQGNEAAFLKKIHSSLHR